MQGEGKKTQGPHQGQLWAEDRPVQTFRRGGRGTRGNQTLMIQDYIVDPLTHLGFSSQ